MQASNFTKTEDNLSKEEVEELIANSQEIRKIIDQYDLAEDSELTTKRKLFLIIKKELSMLALIAAQRGESFDLKQALVYAKQKIDLCSVKELQNIQRRYDYYFWSSAQNPPESFKKVSAEVVTPVDKTETDQELHFDFETADLEGYLYRQQGEWLL